MAGKKSTALQSTKHGSNKDKRVGLARALSKLGFCSRTQAFALIREGKVRLNGATPRNPETPVRLGVDGVGKDLTAFSEFIGTEAKWEENDVFCKITS